MSQYQSYQTGHFSQQSNVNPSFESYKNSQAEFEGGGGVPRFGGETNYSQNQNSVNVGFNDQNYESIKREQGNSYATSEQMINQRELRQESTVEVLKKAEDIIRNSQFVEGGALKKDYPQKSVQPFQTSSNQFISDNLANTTGIGKVDILKRADQILRNSQLSQIEVSNNPIISPSPSGGLYSNPSLQKERSVDDIIAEIKSRPSQQQVGPILNYKPISDLPISQNYGGYSSRDASPIGQIGSGVGIGLNRPAGITSSYVSIGNNLTPTAAGGGVGIGGVGLSGNYSPSANVNDILNRYKNTQTFTSQYSENMSLPQEFPQTGGSQLQHRTFAEDDTMRNNYNDNSLFDINQYTHNQNNPSHHNSSKLLQQNVSPKLSQLPPNSSQFTPSSQQQQQQLAQQVSPKLYGGNTVQNGSIGQNIESGQNQNGQIENGISGYNSNKIISHQSSYSGQQNNPLSKQNNFMQSDSNISSSNPAIEELVKKYSQKSLSSSFVQQNNPSSFYRQASMHNDSQKDLANVQSNSSLTQQNKRDHIQEYQNTLSGQAVFQGVHSPVQYTKQDDYQDKIKKSSAAQKQNNQYSASKQEKIQQEYSGSNDKVKVQVYSEMLKRKKRDRIHHNAAKIICYHIWVNSILNLNLNKRIFSIKQF